MYDFNQLSSCIVIEPVHDRDEVLLEGILLLKLGSGIPYSLNQIYCSKGCSIG
jgi:hypothetical protein